MKRIVIIFAAILALSFSLDTASVCASPYYYFVFNNLDDQKGHTVDESGTVQPATITNMLELYYWDLWQTREEWKEFAKFTSFSGATFSQTPAKDMDIAVFPLGYNSTLNTTVGGVRVLDAVQEMLAAGKSVFIIGQVIFTDLDNGVGTWLSDELGIDVDALGGMSLMNDNSFLAYEIMGTGKDDPIYGQVFSHFNGSYGANGGEVLPPSRFYAGMNAFKLKPGAKSTAGALVTNSDYAVSCYREFDNGAKIFFWSVDWANAATSCISYLNYPYIKAIEWITDELPAPKGLLESNEDDFDFGALLPGDSSTKTLIIRNNGRQDLHITDMYFWNDLNMPEEPKAYFLESGEPTKFTLTPGETHKIKIQFKPLASLKDYDYSDDLVIENDGMGNNKKYISLTGTGGENVNYGPYLTMFETDIDFGSILAGGTATRPVTLINDGTTRMTITKIGFDEETEDFRYAAEYHMPEQVEPGEEFSQVIKFTPLEAEKQYTTTMSVETNAINDDYDAGYGNAKITLMGKTVSDKAPADCILDIGKEIKFGVTDSTRIDTLIQIKNTGEEVLTVFSISFEHAGEPISEDMFSWDLTDAFTVDPGKYTYLTLTFKPLEDGEFYGYFYIKSNAPGSHGEYKIWLHGEGKDVPEPEAVYDEIQGVTANVYPNPVTAASKIELNIENDLVSNLNIKIVDIQGRTLQNVANATYAKGIYTFDIKAESWTAGKYFVLITSEDKQTALPIIVE